jgi:hypothetical protein
MSGNGPASANVRASGALINRRNFDIRGMKVARQPPCMRRGAQRAIKRYQLFGPLLMPYEDGQRHSGGSQTRREKCSMVQVIVWILLRKANSRLLIGKWLSLPRAA